MPAFAGMTEEGRAYFGLGPNEAMTFDRLAEFIHPDDRVMWRDNIREALNTGRPLALSNETRLAGALKVLALELAGLSEADQPRKGGRSIFGRLTGRS